MCFKKPLAQPARIVASATLKAEDEKVNRAAEFLAYLYVKLLLYIVGRSKFKPLLNVTAIFRTTLKVEDFICLVDLSSKGWLPRSSNQRLSKPF